MDIILKMPDSSKKVHSKKESSAEDHGVHDASNSAEPNQGSNNKREPVFIQKLITICCGVISPRSLIGLNHRQLDDKYQTAAQVQDIGK